MASPGSSNKSGSLSVNAIVLYVFKLWNYHQPRLISRETGRDRFCGIKDRIAPANSHSVYEGRRSTHVVRGIE